MCKKLWYDMKKKNDLNSTNQHVLHTNSLVWPRRDKLISKLFYYLNMPCFSNVHCTLCSHPSNMRLYALKTFVGASATERIVDIFLLPSKRCTLDENMIIRKNAHTSGLDTSLCLLKVFVRDESLIKTRHIPSGAVRSWRRPFVCGALVIPVNWSDVYTHGQWRTGATKTTGIHN